MAAGLGDLIPQRAAFKCPVSSWGGRICSHRGFLASQLCREVKTTQGQISDYQKEVVSAIACEQKVPEREQNVTGWVLFCFVSCLSFH